MPEDQLLGSLSRKLLFEFADGLVKSSGGRLHIAHNEEDATTDATTEAAHFLKLDECRLGRDLELYAWMSELEGPELLTTRLLEEIVLHIRPIPRSFAEGITWLRWIGPQVFDQERNSKWSTLLTELAAGAMAESIP